MIHPSQRTTISAAICTYNRYHLLEKSIDSLIAQNIDANQYKIIIVDNSPANATALEFKERYHGQRNIQYLIETTTGLSNARNVAAHMCSSEYIAYLDDDAIADAEWLRSILGAFETFGSYAGVVCGKVSPIWSTDPPNWLPRSKSVLGALTIVDWGHPMRIAEPGQWFAGANFSIRVAPLLELGGFALSLGRVGNAGILMSNEEKKLIAQMKAAGYDTIWAPDAKVDHLVQSERISQSWLRKRFVWQAVSDFIADPEEVVKNLEERWENISNYMRHWPRWRRTPGALFKPVVEPELFEKQLFAVYGATILLLAGQEFQRRDERSKHFVFSRILFQLERFHPRNLFPCFLRLLRRGASVDDRR